MQGTSPCQHARQLLQDPLQNRRLSTTARGMARQWAQPEVEAEGSSVPVRWASWGALSPAPVAPAEGSVAVLVALDPAAVGAAALDGVAAAPDPPLTACASTLASA